ncbi:MULTISPECIES: zinc-dependent metalloprotease [Halobacterium]|uniref:zinc-dependent metalloprotease n=1 Tax=Halobacterium TaxID=2239 RepID=UPI0019636D91|nr:MULTISPECIES: zinc-dependent metalloprotease [Halobacterium]MCF2165310.1 zinc-dependent metalloprotease [Halobacterium salinarum]MCF2167881.1 zinc-dependent metalloprotease [Halobacterium salinarum]MCF2238571.1 zinc-dependent metalloprotease [Halobacterium salinarum]QRY21859.1 zinc-dependent metalloprotease [Halobacterium sp. GSL-19]WJK63261.1 zinc-dependent metalloprotease [Halobacterium salinarum]
MSIFESARAVVSADGGGAIDWDSVADAATSATPPGDLALGEDTADAYAADVRDARARIRSVSGLSFDVPETVALHTRHHWVDANVATFRRAFEPMNQQPSRLPGVARTLNTATTAGALAFIARNVLGQYDPLLLADASDAHALYFVHPNIVAVADSLGVQFPRFRRWIAFHEVTHAAEFGAAGWLSDYLETRLRTGVGALADGTIDTAAFEELQVAMTAVEGYAELLMDEAFDGEYDDLRRKLDARRGQRSPLGAVATRLLGLHRKREQYERGREFFAYVAGERGLAGASRVWDDPEYLPTDDELDVPPRWLARVPA